MMSASSGRWWGRSRLTPTRCGSASCRRSSGSRWGWPPTCGSRRRWGRSRSAISGSGRSCGGPPPPPRRSTCSPVTPSRTSATGAWSGSATRSTRRSRTAAERFGFTFEGIFRQHRGGQGPQPRHRLVLDHRRASGPRIEARLRGLPRTRQLRRAGPPAALAQRSRSAPLAERPEPAKLHRSRPRAKGRDEGSGGLAADAGHLRGRPRPRPPRRLLRPAEGDPADAARLHAGSAEPRQWRAAAGRG